MRSLLNILFWLGVSALVFGTWFGLAWYLGTVFVPEATVGGRVVRGLCCLLVSGIATAGTAVAVAFLLARRS
jgi:hypothetical protein